MKFAISIFTGLTLSLAANASSVIPYDNWTAQDKAEDSYLWFASKEHKSTRSFYIDDYDRIAIQFLSTPSVCWKHTPYGSPTIDGKMMPLTLCDKAVASAGGGVSKGMPSFESITLPHWAHQAYSIDSEGMRNALGYSSSNEPTYDSENYNEYFPLTSFVFTSVYTDYFQLLKGLRKTHLANYSSNKMYDSWLNVQKEIWVDYAERSKEKNLTVSQFQTMAPTVVTYGSLTNDQAAKTNLIQNLGANVSSVSDSLITPSIDNKDHFDKERIVVIWVNITSPILGLNSTSLIDSNGDVFSLNKNGIKDLTGLKINPLLKASN